MDIPSRYIINVARKDDIPGWDGQPSYRWFCNINAGENLSHAKKVAEAARDLFPADIFKLTLAQEYSHLKTVSNFGDE